MRSVPRKYSKGTHLIPEDHFPARGIQRLDRVTLQHAPRGGCRLSSEIGRWCKLSSSWNEEPRYNDLVDDIGTAGLLLPPALHAFAARAATSGDLSKVTPRSLARSLRLEDLLKGDGKTPDDLVAALKRWGYLTEDNQIAGWDEIFGLAASYRTRASKAGKARAAKAASLSDSPSGKREDENREDKIREEGDAEHHAQHDADGGRLGLWSAGIWDAYPKQVGRPAALAAIAAAIEREGGDFAAATRLLQIVRAYAKAVSKWPRDEFKFVPAPAKWFGESLYDDNPKTWRREEKRALPLMR